MKLFLATDQNFAIGYQGQLLFHISEDLKRFKRFTTGQIIVMGRNTYESLPNRPLPNRTSIVVTHGNLESQENLYVIHSLEELEPLLQRLNPQGEKEVYVIGGGVLVAELINSLKEAYITMVQHRFDRVDAWIPNLDSEDRWIMVEESDPKPYKDWTYTFRKYVRK